jgi:carboxylesterase type B
VVECVLRCRTQSMGLPNVDLASDHTRKPPGCPSRADVSCHRGDVTWSGEGSEDCLVLNVYSPIQTLESAVMGTLTGKPHHT